MVVRSLTSMTSRSSIQSDDDHGTTCTTAGNVALTSVVDRGEAGQIVKVATTAAWSDGAGGRGYGSSSIDGPGLAATISTLGRLPGFTSRWEAKMWSMSSPRPAKIRVYAGRSVGSSRWTFHMR